MARAKYGDVPRLEDYGVSPTFGFLHANPTIDLPDYFKPWTSLATNTTDLVDSGEVRERIEKMPVLDHNQLDGPRQWKAALVLLTALANAYVWCNGEDDIPEVLPRCVAIPYATVAAKLQVTPSLTAWGFSMINWKLKDPNGQVELDNMETLVQIRGGADESWFMCVANQVELDFAPALCSTVEAQKAVIDGDVEKLNTELQTIERAIRTMTHTQSRMPERCRPHVFYNVFRPFLAGWDSPAFKKKNLDGLIYEGVSDQPFSFTGGSTAQSSTLPCLDAAFGVEKTHSKVATLKSFEQYMPKPHRDLIAAISKGPSIKSFVHSCGSPEAVRCFNACLSGMRDFRNGHLKLVGRYVLAMSRRDDTNNQFSQQAETGTGGTGFLDFLTSLRNATIQTMLVGDHGLMEKDAVSMETIVKDKLNKQLCSDFQRAEAKVADVEAVPHGANLNQKLNGDWLD
ncbi:indoleamine 2,3-dioxygenase 2-like [Diadema setosum]|uniref:indoleamine 2,3-dioxygenase 2-like n=1 Tax=Diadema setosum TaxID=31175 RepID=UPI003B3AF9F2